MVDNLCKFNITESESLLIGRNFGIGTDIQPRLNSDLLVVSRSNDAIYEMFRSHQGCHYQRCRSERAQIAGTASKHQKRFVGGARNAEEYSQISGLCPRGCAVCLRGAPVSVP